jgi:hypothetical protein
MGTISSDWVNIIKTVTQEYMKIRTDSTGYFTEGNLGNYLALPADVRSCIDDLAQIRRVAQRTIEVLRHNTTTNQTGFQYYVLVHPVAGDTPIYLAYPSEITTEIERGLIKRARKKLEAMPKERITGDWPVPVILCCFLGFVALIQTNFIVQLAGLCSFLLGLSIYPGLLWEKKREIRLLGKSLANVT